MNQKTDDLASNRRVFHDYEILETLEAGIVLQGTEIKSIRNNGASLQEAYVRVINQELWLIGCHISPYKFGNIHNHQDKQDRKLLVHKREIRRLKTATQEKGLALVAIAMYLKSGRVKVKIAIAKGKKMSDKRADIKEKDEKRRINQALKNDF